MCGIELKTFASLIRPSRFVVASFLLMRTLVADYSLTFGASCLIQSMLLAKEHCCSRYLSENCFKGSFWLFVRVVLMAPGELFGAFSSNQDAFRCLARLYKSILRVELATKLILGDFGSIVGPSGGSPLGSKMKNKAGRSAKTNC